MRTGGHLSEAVVTLDKQRIDEVGIDYVERFSLYDEYSARVRNLVQDLVEREDIEVCGIESWAKTPAELVKSLNAHYADEDVNLGSISDLVTVRVLLRFPEDVSKVEKVVMEEFEANPDLSVPSSGLEDPFRFGYPAVHYILSLSENRVSLREWQKYKDLFFRLEVRTVLQEAWATISPRVSLNADPPSEKKLKRKLLRLAALLEEADEGFLSLWEEAREAAVLVPSSPEPLRKETPITAERTFSEEELYDFFNAEGNGALNRWSSTVIKAGFPIFVPSPNYLRESFQYMYRIFRASGIDTITEVQKFLADMEEGEKGLLQLRAVQEAFGKDSSVWRVDAFSAIFLLVLNLRWDTLKSKDLVQLGVKKGSDRISGMDG
ncbi:MAG: RelA/SpoT domain-containing protein [Synergistaceae bacterium]|nr:RelA/SpoT domain-containing protein [Synergistaceae bacterium]